MRVVGLVAFRNEAHVLESCLRSMQGCVDEIVGLDDGSSDQSADVFSKVVGEEPLRAVDYAVRPWSVGGEKDLRDVLMGEGRRRGGTHFLVLDADECLTSGCQQTVRDHILRLSPGQSLAIPWLICWKSTSDIRVDPGVWDSPYKDFAFADEEDLAYPDGIVQHLPRTPVTDAERRTYLPRGDGGVIHYQFAFWETTQIKQAWYRCIDWTQSAKDARQINRTYRVSEETEHARVAPIPASWMPQIVPSEPTTDWRKREVFDWFQSWGVEHFEPLNIWEVPEFRAAFVEATGRAPSPDLRSDLWMRVQRRLLRAWKRDSRA